VEHINDKLVRNIYKYLFIRFWITFETRLILRNSKREMFLCQNKKKKISMVDGVCHLNIELREINTKNAKKHFSSKNYEKKMTLNTRILLVYF
jgi:hypothetical protein